MTPARRHESGFVLVGVIMFVLALTILGMSLFAISSFESQFLGQSRDENAALYAAQGGLDLAREVLAVSPYTLASSHSIESIEGVTYAVAWQRRPGNTIDSTGVIDFSSDSVVTIQVTTQVRGATRVVRASYEPAVLQNYYKRLFTITNTIDVETTHPALGGTARTTLSGPIWQQSTADSSWIGRVVSWTNRGGFIRRGTVPPPDANAFLTARAALVESTPIDTSGPPGPGGFHTIWNYPGMAPAPATTAHYYGDLQHTDSTWVPQHLFPREVNVTLNGGIAVWLFPTGLYANHIIKVFGNGTLVIVGAATPQNGQIGIHLNGGISTDNNVRLVLVSDGAIYVRQDNDYDTPGPLQHLSVYSSALRLLGPSGPHHETQSCAYGAGMDSAIDALMDLDALPRPSAAVASSFTIVRGSWRDLTP